MLKRILAAVAASAVSLCIFTACGSDPKYDTSVFIKTASARTGYELKESKSLDNALQAGLDALSSDTKYTKDDNPGYEQIAYDSIKKALGDPDATKYQYITSGIVRGNLRAFARSGGSPVAAYTFYSAAIRDFDKEYKDLNSTQLYEAPAISSIASAISSFPASSSAPSMVLPLFMFRKRSPSASRPSRSMAKTSPYIFVLLKGTMSIDS